MSKEKVERYKQEKANRKETLAKEKRKKLLTKIGLWALAVVLVGGIAGAIGVTVFNKYEAYQASLPDYTSASSFMLDDLAGVRSEHTHTHDEAESESAEEESKADDSAAEDSSEAQSGDSGSEESTEKTE